MNVFPFGDSYVQYIFMVFFCFMWFFFFFPKIFITRDKNLSAKLKIEREKKDIILCISGTCLRLFLHAETKCLLDLLP